MEMYRKVRSMLSYKKKGGQKKVEASIKNPCEGKEAIMVMEKNIWKSSKQLWEGGESKKRYKKLCEGKKI